MVFGRDAQVLHDSRTEPKSRPQSEAATYLINNGNFTKEEIASVTPFLESAKIEILAHRDGKERWTFWKANGDRIKTTNLKVPVSVQKDSKTGDAFALMVQTMVLPWPKDLKFSEDNYVILEGPNHTSLSPKRKESWLVLRAPKDPFVDLPFTFTFVQPLLTKLPIHEGESVKFPDVQLTVAKIAPATKDLHTTNSVHVLQVGTIYPRLYQLSPAFEAMPSNDNPALKSWMLTDAENTWSSKLTFNLTVCSDAKFSDWHAINVGRKTTFSGFFGHVAMRPIETTR